MLTKLESINIMLSVIGEAPIADIQININNPDANLAVNILDEVTKSTQLRGWHFNIEPETALYPDVNGEIHLPKNIGRVAVKLNKNLVQRGKRLYDKINKTFKFSTAVIADVLFILDYDELPPTAQYYISIKASRIFQARCLGSETIFKYTTAEEADALKHLRKAEGITGQYNIFKDNYEIAHGLLRN